MYAHFEPVKLTEELKTHVPDVTALAARRKAHALGMTLAEYVRDLICLAEHGASYDDLMREHRRLLRAQQGRLMAQVQAETGPASFSVLRGGVAA